jgi:hypothetical protein
MSLIKKLREPRIGPFAIFDFAASYTAAWFSAPYLKSYVSREQLLYLTVPLGILVHAIFKIETPLNKMVMGPEGNTLARIIVLAMLVGAYRSHTKLD